MATDLVWASSLGVCTHMQKSIGKPVVYSLCVCVCRSKEPLGKVMLDRESILNSPRGSYIIIASPLFPSLHTTPPSLPH